MTSGFPGHRVIVTGGSRGIGLGIARAFAQAGADVAICARSLPALEAASTELGAFGHRVLAAACDVGDGPALQRFIEEVAGELGGIDVLVNNPSALAMGVDEAAWQALLQVDVMGTVRATNAALPWLREGRNPCVLNVSSISGVRANARTVAYSAAKGLLGNYTAGLAGRLAAEGIRVNAIAPGSVEFPGGTWESRRLANDPLHRRTLESIPMGRMGTVEDIAPVALFLASEQARWITGQTICVDGGQSL